MVQSAIRMQGKSSSAQRIWQVLQTLCLLATLAALSMPFTSGDFGSAGVQAVTGWDMVVGRTIEGYPFGLQKQMMALLPALFMLASLALLFTRRDRPVFISSLCSFFALGTLFLLQFPGESHKKFDPVVAGIFDSGLSPWYYLTLALLFASTAMSALRICRLPSLRKDIVAHRWLYGMAIPILIYVLVFFYYPIYGVLIAFKDFSPRLGMLNSPWVGFKHFQAFFSSFYFTRLIGNTLMISFYDLLFGFTAPILFALFLNEMRSVLFKRTVQTLTYLPHFISLVIICGLLKDFLSSTGLINGILRMFGASSSMLVNHLADPRKFRMIYTASGIWQSMGWGSIIYLSALTGIDPQLYEAARVDGAKRLRMMLSVTFPGIAPTIIIMLILRIGNIMNVGYEKIILLYSPTTYETADVISSYVYRSGILNSDYSFSTAVGLFNSVISLILVISSNKISQKITDIGLW